MDETNIEHPEWLSILKAVKFAYANKVAMFINNWDVRISFGDENPASSVEPVVGVVLSYQTAKAFSELLAKNIKVLEDEVGLLPEVGSGIKYKKTQSD